MALGLLVMAVGCLVFIPAAYTRTYGLFLTGLFVQGMGLAVLQTAANPYVSILGPLESAAQRISIMGICNKVAGILSPIILSSIVLRGAKEIEMRVNTAVDAVQRVELLDALAERAIPPYIGDGCSIRLVGTLYSLVAFARYSSGARGFGRLLPRRCPHLMAISTRMARSNSHFLLRRRRGHGRRWNCALWALFGF